MQFNLSRDRTTTFADYLNAIPRYDIQSLMQEMRTIITAHEPLQEKIFWNALTYSYNGDLICAVLPRQEHVMINFFSNGELSDPTRSLKRKDRMVQYVNFVPGEDIPREQIRWWIEELIAKR